MTCGSPDEHAHGFSSLTLLTAAEPAGRTLYLLSWTAATLAAARPHERSMPIALAGWPRLPLASGSIDVVIADLDVVPGSAAVRRAVAAELRRVLTPRGECVGVVAHSRVPRDPRQWSRYRLTPSIVHWRRALAAAGFAFEEPVRLRFDGRRLAEVELPHAANGTGRRAHAMALRVAMSSMVASSTLERIFRALQEEVRALVPITRMQVRKIGKTAAFVPAVDSEMVVRLPCSPLATNRARQNHDALEALRRWPSLTRGLVPVPLGCGTMGAHSYFVETRRAGTPREPRGTGVTWEPQAVEWITALHLGTARREVCSDAWFDERIEPALGSIERAPIDSGSREVLAWLRSALRDRLVGRELPLVRSHGDYTSGNCLYESDGRLSGIVDWELSRPDALPLLDLLQCFDIPSEYVGDRWHRADLILDAVEGRGPLVAAREIVAYLDALHLPRDVMPALLLMHWVDHGGARVLARQCDRRWFSHRIEAPLARLCELARAAASRG